MKKIQSIRFLAVAVVATLTYGTSAEASFTSDLNYSNSNLAPSFGTVTVSDLPTVEIDNVVHNVVQITFDASYPGAGFFRVAFNTFISPLTNLPTSNIAVPSGWSVNVAEGQGGYGPFGKFEITSSIAASQMADPLIITITQPGITAANFVEPGTRGVYFSAHYRLSNGFTFVVGTYDVTQDPPTDVSAVPAPSSAILALAGLPVIGLIGWRRHRQAALAGATIA